MHVRDRRGGRHGHGLHVLPERRGEPRDERRDALPGEPVADRAVLAPALDQPGRTQRGEVVRDLGLRLAERLHQLAHGALPLREGEQDRHARGVAERTGERPGVGWGRYGGRIRHR